VFINHVITSITNYIDYYGNIITNVLLIIYLRIFTYSNIYKKNLKYIFKIKYYFYKKNLKYIFKIKYYFYKKKY